MALGCFRVVTCSGPSKVTFYENRLQVTNIMNLSGIRSHSFIVISPGESMLCVIFCAGTVVCQRIMGMWRKSVSC